MGTSSYVLTGTEKGFADTFGTTCHGAVGYFRFCLLSHRDKCSII